MDWTPPQYKKQRDSDLAYHRLMQEELSEGEPEAPAMCSAPSQPPRSWPHVSVPASASAPQGKESPSDVMRRNAKRISAIRAYMETLDPDDHMTMSHLEGQLKAARGVARGCKAPSVAMEEALVALADAKVKIESSTRHLATAQDHHNRASADVARCREEYKAAKLMNVAPLQHQHHTEKVSTAATDMAVTLEK